MTNVMIDIETLSTRVDASIISIGAVQFNPEIGIVRKAPRHSFYRVIDGASCLKAGLTIDAKTISWWMQQSEEVRKSVWDAEGVSLKQALTDLNAWMPDDFGAIWSRGQDFDPPGSGPEPGGWWGYHPQAEPGDWPLIRSYYSLGPRS